MNDRTVPRKTRGSRDLSLSPAEVLASKLVEKPSGCIEWSGFTDRDGYGQFGANRKKIATHRLAWEIANGPIPDGGQVLHRCDNPPCCNPAQLFIGTHADNMTDRLDKGRYLRPKCRRGHKRTTENTHVRIRPNGYTQRTCLDCASGVPTKEN